MLETLDEARIAGVPVPLKFTHALTLFVGMAAVTKAVVASAVVLLPADCVTAVVPVGKDGVPVKDGESSAALVVSVPWTWSARAYRRDVPTAAVPLTSGVADAA
jgi:hypothetical protein